jgi:hypothetical protein
MPFCHGDGPLQVSFEQIVKQRSDCQREINSLLQRQPQYVGLANQALVYLLFLYLVGDNAASDGANEGAILPAANDNRRYCVIWIAFGRKKPMPMNLPPVNSWQTEEVNRFAELHRSEHELKVWGRHGSSGIRHAGWCQKGVNAEVRAPCFLSGVCEGGGGPILHPSRTNAPSGIGMGDEWN